MIKASTQSNTLILGTTIIRQDTQGRFCLNDCHRASGGEANKRPTNFMRLSTTQALIGEINRCSDLSIGSLNILKGGSSQGTYAVRELVYAYAMWISPAFNLMVIRAFDAMVSNQVAVIPSAETHLKCRTMSSTFKQLMQVARACGCTPRQAAERAAIGVEKRWGINPLREMNLLPEHQSLFDIGGNGHV